MKQSVVLISAWARLVGWVDAARAMPVIPATIFNVTNYGAIGDGAKDNTTNIQNTINAANAAGGGIVEIRGHVPERADHPAQQHQSAGGCQCDAPDAAVGNLSRRHHQRANFHRLQRCHDVAISGWGTIDGQGAAWWMYFSTNSTYRPAHDAQLVFRQPAFHP